MWRHDVSKSSALAKSMRSCHIDWKYSLGAMTDDVDGTTAGPSSADATGAPAAGAATIAVQAIRMQTPRSPIT